jgi:uncharacterized protein (DUF697 family)
MAKIGGMTPGEQQLLDKIRATFKLKEEVKFLETISVEQLQEISQPDELEPLTDPVQRAKESHDLISDYSTVTAILGLNPFPGLSLITTLAAYILTFKMMRDIGSLWGYPKIQDTIPIIRNIFGGIGAFAAAFTAWATVSTIGLFVPLVGSVAAASFLYSLTWAMGQVTNQFYASGRQMDSAALKQAFREAKKEGEAAYKTNAKVIAAKQKVAEPQIKALSQDLKTGKITQKEYQAKIQEILSESALHKIKLFSSIGTGIVEKTITPTQPGRIKYQASYWPARLYSKDEQVTLLPDDPVSVVGRQGITLLVVPVNKEVAPT